MQSSLQDSVFFWFTILYVLVIVRRVSQKLLLEKNLKSGCFIESSQKLRKLRSASGPKLGTQVFNFIDFCIAIAKIPKKTDNFFGCLRFRTLSRNFLHWDSYWTSTKCLCKIATAFLWSSFKRANSSCKRTLKTATLKKNWSCESIVTETTTGT